MFWLAICMYMLYNIVLLSVCLNAEKKIHFIGEGRECGDIPLRQCKIKNAKLLH